MDDSFPRWLEAALAATPDHGTIRVEDHQRWSDAVAVNTIPADADAQTMLDNAFHSRLAEGPLTAADRAAALATGIAFVATHKLPREFTVACEGDDLFVGLAAQVNTAVAEEASSPAGRARLVWLLRAVRHHRDAIVTHLTPAAALALDGVASLTDGRSLPDPTPSDGPFLAYLRELAGPPVRVGRPRPTILERVRQSCGGNRYEMTRTGASRAAVLLVLLAITAIALVTYLAAQGRLQAFREQNHLPDYEKSLIAK